ncbi:MAG: orotidine-5'-phosphate decarboxylase [Lentisphaeria bacterium]|nr:MAG: orotidine-5'-phosphate decarboxylase [Lentisphaeria bacterium]
MNFYEKLKHAAQLNRSLVCVGLDPDLKKLPACLAGKKNPIFEFNKAIIDATRDWVCCYKPQVAYYAGQGAEAELRMTIDYIREQAPLVPVILDAKRGRHRLDRGDVRPRGVRAVQCRCGDGRNPYMGFDTLKPFLDYADRGVVILCRTSNPNSGDLQNLMCDGKMVYEHVAELARDKWNYNHNVALVIGATYPEELRHVRELCPELPFLVPGVGAQGGRRGEGGPLRLRRFGRRTGDQLLARDHLRRQERSVRRGGRACGPRAARPD